jgi:hypothetical protein
LSALVSPQTSRRKGVGIGRERGVALGSDLTEEIASARGDAKNGLLIGLYLHEANRWIYGDGAFGLRFIAWIARKPPEPVIDGMTLLMFRLRQVPGAILPSDKIAEMAENARMSVFIQRGMSGTGAIIPASRRFFTRNELNWPSPTKLR